MADPFSVTASAVSLADALWRTSKELYGFFSAVKDASKDVRSMLLELQQFEDILTSIKNNAYSFNNSAFVTDDGLSASGLLTNLQYCSAEFKVLKDIVEDSRRNHGQGSVKKFASKFKWVFDEKKIAQCCQRLEKVKLLLNTVLSLAGRKDNEAVHPQNDIIIRGQLKSTQDGIQAAQTASSSQHQSLIHQVQQSTTETHERLSIGFTSLNDMTQAIQSDTTTLKRKFEETQEEAASRTEFVRSDLSLANSSILKVDQMVRTGVTQISKRQRRLEQQQTDSTVRLLEGMDRMQAMLSTHLRDAPPAGTAHPENMSNTIKNLDRIVMPLMLMKSSLCEVLGLLESGSEIFLSKEEVQLLQSEINEILAAGHEASAAALRRRQLREEDEGSASLGQQVDMDSRRSPRSYELCSQPLSARKHQRKAPWKQFVRSTFAGTLSIRIQRLPGLSSTPSGASISFLPNPELFELGVSVVLTKELKAAVNPEISRCIRTFKVFSRHDPTYYGLDEVFRQDNVSELQSLLSEKAISPWDRTTELEGSESLLRLAARWGAYDAARLLLQEGADIDSNLLWEMWTRSWFVGNLNTIMDAGLWVKFSELVIQYGASAEDSREGNFSSNPYLANFLFLPQMGSGMTLPLSDIVCKHFIRIGCNIEARNKKGQTPLLYAAHYYRNRSAHWLQGLIMNGADLTATDTKGRGPFHYLFLGFVEAIKSRYFFTPRLYRLFKEKTDILLNSGCHPFHRDLKGHLPACHGCDINMYDTWRSLLGERRGREVATEECFCECGGLYELADTLKEERELMIWAFKQRVKWWRKRIKSLRRWSAEDLDDSDDDENPKEDLKLNFRLHHLHRARARGFKGWSDSEARAGSWQR